MKLKYDRASGMAIFITESIIISSPNSLKINLYALHVTIANIKVYYLGIIDCEHNIFAILRQTGCKRNSKSVVITQTQIKTHYQKRGQKYLCTHLNSRSVDYIDIVPKIIKMTCVLQIICVVCSKKKTYHQHMV